ncbi:tRNA pseudouridine(54/55) synthase Pus10 [Stetteria hydrogenophila]
MSIGDSWVLRKAAEVLSETPLCDRCLGRLFAQLGHGLSNKERGWAIKLLLAMELHRLAREGSLPEGVLETLAPRLGRAGAEVYRVLKGRDPPEAPACAICGGGLDEFISRAAERGLKLLRAFDVKRFVVGVKLEGGVEAVEDEVKRRHGLAYGESIRSELRREIGKLLQRLDPSLEADFDNPEATLLVHYPTGEVDLQVNSLLLAGRYWKRGRLISQAYWPSPTGPKYFSVEQAAWGLLKLTGGERVVVHAAGREDVDARMLGTGRPLIIEVKSPRRRQFSLEELERAANAGGRGVVEFKLEGLARRRDVRLYKEEAAERRKAYKALIAVEREVTPEDVERLEEEFRGRVVLQRTPRRVLHRRPDVLRRKRVHSVKCRLYGGGVMECVIAADGGLYVKELVSGDDGRTTPSFSEVLGAGAECIELDVIAVEGVKLFVSTPGTGAVTREGKG